MQLHMEAITLFRKRFVSFIKQSCIGISILGLLVPASYSADKNSSAGFVEKYNPTEYQFSNGFRALLIRNDKAVQTAVTLVYFSGSLSDPEEKSGLAHLVEHLMFSAPTTQGDDLFLREMARRSIAYNGNTSFERTIYSAAFSNNQDTLSWLLAQKAQRMYGLNISESDIARELQVVMREKEIGDSDLTQNITQQMLPAVTRFSPYGRPPIGNEVELHKITVNDARAFYKTHYRLENALLIITGQFDTQSTLNQLQALFGEIQHSQNKSDIQPLFFSQEVQPTAPPKFVGQANAAFASVVYPLSGQLDAKRIATVYLLSNILTGSPASRLHQSLVSTGAAASVMANPLIFRNAGVFEVTAIPVNSDAAAVEQAFNKLFSQLKLLASALLTEEELSRAKVSLRNYSEQKQSAPAAFGYLLAEAASSGDWRWWFESTQAAETISLMDIQRAAKNILQQNDPVVALISRPRGSETMKVSNPELRDAAPARSFTSTPVPQIIKSEIASPARKDADALKVDAQIDRFTINDTLAVALWPKPTSDNRVRGVWNLRMGTAESLFGKRILADVTGNMLAYGSQNLNQLQLFDRVNLWGAHLFIVPSDDRLSIVFDTPAKSLPDLIHTLIDLLRNPQLPQSGLEEIKGRLQVAYQSQITKPEVLAEEAVTAVISSYPVGDIRREPNKSEALAALRTINLSDVKDFHREFYGTNGELMLFGEFDVKAVRRQLEKLLASWSSKQPYQRPPVPYKALAPSQHFINATNATHGIYTAKLRLPVHAEESDALALKLFNFVLGEDTLQSRLGQRLRQNEGISYRVGSQINISTFEPRATLTISATYPPEMRQQLSRAVHEELTLLVKDGLTDTELKSAKDNWRTRNEFNKISDIQIFGKLNPLLRLNRDMQYYAEENSRVETLTLAQVNEAIARLINANHLLEVFVDAEITSELVSNE